MRIVLVRAGALGDTILTFPAVEALRRRYPGARIEAVGNGEAWSLAEHVLDAIHEVEISPLGRLLTGTVSEEAGRVLAGTDVLVVWSTRPVPAEIEGVGKVVQASPYPPPGIHAAEWLVRTVERGALESSVQHGGAPRDREGDGVRGEDTSSTLGHGTTEGCRYTGAMSDIGMWQGRGLERQVLIHPGAGAAWKRWPAERFAEVVRELQARGRRVALIEGPADEGSVREVIAAVGEQAWGATAPAEHPQISVVRNLPLRALAEVMREAALVIGNDSGISHLAAMAGGPVVALFGPTDPANWAPLGRVEVVRKCAARTERQGQVRVCEEPGCMEAIRVGDVLEAIERLEDGAGGRG